jgi:hypothetical protein
MIKNKKYEILTPSGFSNFDGISSKFTQVIFHIELSNGSYIKCTAGHEIKFPNGEFLEACFIRVSDILFGDLEVVKVEYFEEECEVFDLINVEKNNEYYTNRVVSHNCAFIDNAEDLFGSAQQTLATGGKCIALSTPNGVGNWFHKTYIKAQKKENSFVPVCLPWTVHPERDQSWRDKQDQDLGVRMAAQECDGDFSSSGNTVIIPDILAWYEENMVLDPLERRGLDKAMWVWEYPSPLKTYLLCADVARGDGADYSAFHIIDVDTLTQVAEYQAQCDTREFAKTILAAAFEYNNALVAVENANIGWDVLKTLIESGYQNLHYSHRTDFSLDQEKKLERYGATDSLVPGFTMSSASRPLIIERMRDFIETKQVKIRSVRLLEELRVFIWKNSKPQAMQGYNDDLVMSFAITMYMRDSSIRFRRTAESLTYATLDAMKKTSDTQLYNTSNFMNNNPYQMEISTKYGNSIEDISWLLG